MNRYQNRKTSPCGNSRRNTRLAGTAAAIVDRPTTRSPRRSPADSSIRSSRRGTLLLAVLVCLIVATSLLTAMVQSALASRRQVRSLARLAQVELLLQSGFDRAVAQIAANSEYRGETWRLPAVSLAAESLAAASPGVGGSPSGASGGGGAEVTIQIEPSTAAEIVSTDGPASQVATIVAEYPAGQIDSVRRTRRYELMSR